MDEAKKAEFHSLYEAKKTLILKAALHYSQDRAVAEDIVQTVFLELYKRYQNVEEEYVEYWLLRVTKNMALNYCKAKKKELLFEEMPLENNKERAGQSAEEKLVENEQKKITNSFREELLEALFLENETWYEAITLTYCLERPQKEVAMEMGISIGALHSMLYRAKKWVQKKYGDKYKKIKE